MNRAIRTASLALAVAISACGGGNDQAPADLSYSLSPAVYTAGTPITPNAPTVGGGAVSWYRISPTLPDGLSFSANTGVISGTPTVVAATTQYRITASNSGGSASIMVSITVSQPAAPAIVSQPATQVVALDQTASFSVGATGSGALTYQWHRDGAVLAGQTGTSLTTDPITYLDDDAQFVVVVSDSWGGSTASTTAKIRLEGFVATGSMLQARQNFAASRLATGGKVLVTGGLASGPRKSAELYDPATGAFTATGDLLGLREDHTSSLLANGKVLIAGGEGGIGGGTPLATSELYDPDLGIFSVSGSMATARTYHTATVLAGGNVLVTGGQWNVAARAILDTAEVYDADNRAFLPAGSMNVARYWHTATLLPDGKVLIAGGYGLTGAALDRAEIYDPETGLFTETGPMGAARYGHSATLLAADGVVLLAGGFGAGVQASAELYDPGSGTFQSTGDLNFARHFHSATALPGGRVLLAGGITTSEPLSSAELYDPLAGTFTATESMEAERYYHTATLLDSGEVLVVGGWSMSNGGLSTAELFAGAP
jgi:hypothetical protein